MNKGEIIKLVSDTTGYPQKVVREVISGLRDVVFENFTKEPMRIIDGITLTTIDRPACVRRNPRTGEPINVAAKKFPKVKIGKAFKEAANQ